MGCRLVFALLVTWAAAAVVEAVSLDWHDFVQTAAEPTVAPGAPATSTLEVVWETRAERDRPRVIGYELQYAKADIHGNIKGSADAAWQSVQGDAHSTWDLTIRVDGFDRLDGKNHTVQDGWFKLALLRTYPKPSPLPDLRVVTDDIKWDDSWSHFETKIKNAIRDSKHKQYSNWTVSVVRCDETEQRSRNHWAGGCPFLEYGGFTWHIRLNPPQGVLATTEDYPVLMVEKETVTARWSGDGDQVLVRRYSLPSQSGDTDPSDGSAQPGLLDPFFCQDGTCSKSIEGLREGTPYLIRLRAYNQNGFGPWTSPSSHGNVKDGMATSASTASKLVPPSPEAPRLSSKSSESLTVFTGAIAMGHMEGSRVQAYNFEVIEASDTTGDASRWAPVLSDASDVVEESMGSRGEEETAVPVVSARGLRPSTGYRFRVSARNSEGVGPVSIVSDVFTTDAGLPERAPSTPVLDAASKTSNQAAVTWTSWLPEMNDLVEDSPFEAQWQRLGNLEWREAVVTSDGDGVWRATASGLRGYTQHRFRVRAVNSVGNGEWSTESEWARTAAEFASVWFEDDPSTQDDPSQVTSISGDEDLPANMKDFDYYHGVGRGGEGVEGGGNGVAVIIARIPGVRLPIRNVLFFSGTMQLYAVPTHSRVDRVTVKLWGAGGGGIATPADFKGDTTTDNSQGTIVAGGGGGFLQAQVSVTPGELLQVMVGGGGEAASGEVGGAGGFNGGQTGGSGSAGGGGGGGSTSVHRNDKGQLLAAAGGGGGAGNADICCAYGGSGGGERGGDGGSSAFEETALVSTASDGSSHICRGGWCSETVSEDINVQMLSSTTGGYGGTTVAGGNQGRSAALEWIVGGGGKQGAVSSPRVLGSDEVSIPIVFGGKESHPATPGISLSGGLGADGLRAGGGGGGGFFGGGGGGSGKQGGGGGGGSSYVDTPSLADLETSPSPIEMTLIAVGDTWAELEWNRQDDVDYDQEATWYQVEMSRGRGNEDFSVAAEIDALDGYNPAVTTNAPRLAAGGPPATIKTFLAGLAPESDYNVRVSAIARSGPGKPSKLLSLSTASTPVNVWERLAPRAAFLERGGGGLAGGVLGTPHLGQSDSYEDAGALSDPPTVRRQKFPAARSGHSMVVINNKIYLFGGRARSRKCSSPIVGSSALGDTPGGANLDDCRSAHGFSAEVWEFDPLTSMWTELLVGGSSPAPREGHSASVVGSRMVVFGGRGSSDINSTRVSAAGGTGIVFFGDEWEIDLDPSKSVVVAANYSTTIPEGTTVYSPIMVDQSEYAGMCVSNMSVSLDIDHPCTGQLTLHIFGPGPPNRDARQYQGGAVMSRGEKVTLFRTYNGTDGGSGVNGDGSCGNGMGPGLKLSDAASEGIWECCGKGSAFQGHYRPFGRLLVGRYLHMPAAGQWTLGVLDGEADGLNGTVREWSLELEMRPCDILSSLRWINLTANSTTRSDQSAPQPRAHHTAVAVAEDIFISGGIGSTGAISDLWRREGANTSDASLSQWVLLATGADATLKSTGARRPYGAALTITPWGLLSMAGMVQGRGVDLGPEVWVLDPVSRRWRTVVVEERSGPDQAPLGRYQPATAILTAWTASRGMDTGPGVLLFGGKDDWRRHDDIWGLRLNSLPVHPTRVPFQDFGRYRDIQVRHSASRPYPVGSWSAAEAGRSKRCLHLFVAGTANDTWHATCGYGVAHGESGSCDMDKVLERAWCLGQYQWIGSP